MSSRRPAVTKAQWERGLAASRRLGLWLKNWEERARRLREGEESEPPPRPRRRRPRP
jgi:hypothetical protein